MEPPTTADPVQAEKVITELADTDAEFDDDTPEQREGDFERLGVPFDPADLDDDIPF